MDMQSAASAFAAATATFSAVVAIERFFRRGARESGNRNGEGAHQSCGSELAPKAQTRTPETLVQLVPAKRQSRTTQCNRSSK